ENNGYAIHTHQRLRQKNPNIAERAAVYGMPAQRIESGDVLEMQQRVKSVVDARRSGQPGPFFFECLSYLWKEHVGPNEDYQLGYRTAAEAEPWIKADQVKVLAALVEPGKRRQIEEAVE